MSWLDAFLTIMLMAFGPLLANLAVGLYFQWCRWRGYTHFEKGARYSRVSPKGGPQLGSCKIANISWLNVWLEFEDGSTSLKKWTFWRFIRIRAKDF